MSPNLSFARTWDPKVSCVVTLALVFLCGAAAGAVAAIRQISGVMGDISRFTSSIAASVEEQSASTQEIGRNVQQAASGANELAGSMTNVTEAIQETNKSASQVLDASGALASQAGMLQEAVDQFLERVAAA